MKKLLPILLLLAVSACERTRPASFEDYVTSVTLRPTDNALRYQVDIVTARDCEPQVEVRQEGTDRWKTMPGRTLLFLYPETAYAYRVRVGELTGEPVSFTTGALPEEVPSYTVDLDQGGPEEGYLLYAKENAPGYLVFTDMQARVVWYERFEDEGVRCMHFVPAQGKIAVLSGHKDETASTAMHRPRYGQHLYLIDLEGNRLASIPTTASHTEFPHHEAKLMPDGNLLTVEAVIGYYDLSGVGGSARADVWGDGYVILSPDGRRIASWSCLPALDVMANLSWLDPVLYQYDLVHGNSVSWDENGDFYLTYHYISEVWKVDGRTGKVLYRLGEHGNLSLDGPYASGFHAVVPLSPDRFLVNTNGARYGEPTRAQIYEVDPVRMTARRVFDVQAPEGFTSTTGGNVEFLPDGKSLLFNVTQARSLVITDLEGRPLKVYGRKNTSYRAFYFADVFPSR